MNKISITNKIINEYVDQYLESSKKIDYTELTEESGIKTVLFKKRFVITLLNDISVPHYEDQVRLLNS